MGIKSTQFEVGQVYDRSFNRHILLTLSHAIPHIMVLIVVTIGVVLRLSNLDQAVYWGDEAYSSLRIFGHTTTHLRETIATGRVVSSNVVQAFQHLAPNHSVYSTLKSLAIEDAHIAPLYFVLARIWASIFGDSVAALRSLSAVFGVLSIPAIYYLAIELFEPRNSPHHSWQQTQRIARWSMVLLASSPLQLLMAREARMYSLWTLLTIISSIFLLRALKQPTWERWGLFSIALTLNLYSNFLAVVTGFSFLVYVLIMHWSDRAIKRQFGFATSLSTLAFAPWMSLFLTRQIVDNRDSEGVIGPAHWRLALRNWFALLRRLVIDFDTSPNTSVWWAIALVCVGCLGLGVIGYGSYRLYREQPRRIWLFIALLTLPLPIGFFDRSLQNLLPPRYLLPSYIGIQLIIAYALGQARYQPKRNRQLQRIFWPITMATIVATGLLSSGQAATAESWWNKRFSNCNPTIAYIVNQAPKPLVISDGTGGQFFDHGLSNLLSLSHKLKPDTALQINLETAPAIPIAPGYTDRFVVTPSQILRDRLEASYPGKLKPLLIREDAYRGSNVCLWQLLP